VKRQHCCCRPYTAHLTLRVLRFVLCSGRAYKGQEYARGIAEILYQEAAPEDLASLGDIEKTIRQQT